MLTSQVHGDANPKPLVASLAPVCGRAATQGDAVAVAIIDAASAELARAVQAVVANGEFGSDAAVVGLQGGAMANVAGLREALCARLAEDGLRASTEGSAPAVAGAAQLAAKALGWR